jgi:hypothetical protein
MKRTAVLLGAWLLLAGTVRAAGPESAPMPQVVASPTTPASTTATPVSTTSTLVPTTSTFVSSCGEPCCPQRCWGGHIQRVWNWLTWRPHVDYWCTGIRHFGEPPAPPLYTYFFCQCGYACTPLVAPLYIGVGPPIRDRCCDLNYGHTGGGDCGCGCH